VIFAEEWKLLVWQACVWSFVLCLVAGNSGDYPWRRGEFVQVVFVSWCLVAIISGPIPAGFYVLRLNSRWRYIAGIAIATLAIALLFAVHEITG
jgi:hypothetical protein